ncbi:MAG: nucleotidyltransferase family protein [Parvibaculaceae bacterium]
MRGRWTAIVLAAGRGSGDPLARAYGVSHKCLIPVGGIPMLRRVVDTLRTHPGVASIAISIEEPSVVSTALGTAYPDVAVIPSSDSAPASALAAVEAVASAWPILLTTADHALLDRAMLDHFFSASEGARADLTIGLATAETILAAYPDAKRTFLRFGRDRVSGCNLYGLMSARALGAVDLWQRLDRDRKRPWRIVGAFGAGAIIRYALGLMDLSGALALASRRLNLAARAVLMPFANAAVDVDKPEDKELVEDILGRA